MFKQMVKTILWYMQNPTFLLHMLRTQKVLPLFGHIKDTRKEALAWCKKRAISAEYFVQTSLKSNLLIFENEYKNEFFHAQKMVKKTPVKMGGPGDLNLLYTLSEYNKARRVLETGVAYGWSSLAILKSLGNRNDSRLISINMPYLFMSRRDEQYIGCVVPQSLRNKWILLRAEDRRGIPKAIRISDGNIDMVHYDSDKSYQGRMWAYPILWAALRKDGFFVSDDIGDNTAFRDFLKIIKRKPIVIESGKKYVGIIQK